MDKIMILAIIVLLAVLAKRMKQDFFSPAVINIYWNAFFIVGAVVVFGAGIEWKYAGIYWMLGTCFLCLAGQAIGEYIGNKNAWLDNTEFKRNYLYVVLPVIILIGIAEPLLYLRAFGYSVSDLFNIHALLELNSKVAYDRYYGHEYNPPAISSVISIVIYMGALVGGYVFPIMKNKIGKLLSILTLIPILFLAIITNAKVGVIACIFLWAIGWILHSLIQNRSGKIINTKLIVIGILVAVLGIAFLDLTMVMRIGEISMETQIIVNQKLQEYAFGQIDSFSVWFDSLETTDLDLGSNTYMFLTNWLGITERKQGVYDLMPGIVSNIFTINRGVIADFGRFGGLLYWMLVGLVSGITYKKVKSGSRQCIISTVILGTVYFTILYGFIISPWIYSSYVLAFVGFGILLVLLKVFEFSFTR